MASSVRPSRRLWLLGGLAAAAILASPRLLSSSWASPVTVPQQAADSFAADRREIVAAVSEIVAPGALPGPLAVWGKNAFVVMTGKMNGVRLPLVAAARYGKGRVLAIGHGGFFGTAALENEGNKLFIMSCVDWAGGGNTPNVGVVDNPELAEWFKPLEMNLTVYHGSDLRQNPEMLRKAPPVVFIPSTLLDGASDALFAELDAYVKRGGGVIMDGLGWGWLQLNPGKSLTSDHGGNRFLAPLGIAFADGGFDKTGKTGWIPDTDGLPLAHAETALTALTENAEGKRTLTPAEMAQVTTVLATTMGALPAGDSAFAPRVTALCKKYGGDAVPTRETPITAAQPFARLSAVLYNEEWRRLPADKITANPASANFPGSVPTDAPRLPRTLRINSRIPNWHSTGLYAAPGEAITIHIPDALVKKGWGVRIGSHTDTLWHLPKWERFPDISLHRPLDAATVTVASPFGGAVYIEVPGRSPAGTVEITVAGAVAAPLFVRGGTTLDAWKESRNAPGPWAELVGKRVALSVPSSVIRNLDDPEALMAYWDEVMDRCYELYAAPNRPRPERYCVDRQISAGYMHSGYPIMTGDDVAATFVDLKTLRSPTTKVWGFYHEMGHNFQQPDWTFDGTGEVTNNLFSLYGAEKINGIKAGAHPNMTPEKMEARWTKYRADGANFATWQSDPFLALTMYVQVQKAFGWEPFTRVFAEYRALPASARPKTDLEKHDQWMVRLSRAVSHNLGPFFVAWGVPTSESARKSIATLPAWMPVEDTHP